ncbi:MAG: hypothetical protein HY906_12790 [Deltaproteobacteria bacterium]|nr:hypothetical protein [Deltaproteobacteria bacterium]
MGPIEHSCLLAATLRHNIGVASDVELALREFKTLVRSSDVRLLRSWRDCGATPFAKLPREVQSRIKSMTRQDAPVGFCAFAEVAALERVARRATFLQDIACSTPKAYEAPSPLLESHSPTLHLAVTVAALTEYASQLVGTPSADNRAKLDCMLAFLLRGRESPCTNAVRTALMSKKTTLALTHDLHIYKAKFFPRMVHALLNVFSDDLGDGVLLDPFSGSGTALLEASLLGHRSAGFDVDPLSALVSRCKVEPFARERETTRQTLTAILDELASHTPLFNWARRRTNGRSYLSDELRNKLARRDLRDGTSFLPEIEADLASLVAVRDKLRQRDPGMLEVLLSDAVTKKIRYRFIGVGNGKYTIEVVVQPILDRFRSKVASTLALCDVFDWLQSTIGVRFGESTADQGDATTLAGLRPGAHVAGCITSPPYLPASSGREHYASSRALALSVTGLGEAWDAEKFMGATLERDEGQFDPTSLPAAGRSLLTYLLSDSDKIDPQRDAMRFERKAVPTWRYLLDVEKFLRALRARIDQRGVCLMVVASQHTFYSHRRLQEVKANGADSDSAVEYVVAGRDLYGELAERAGWQVGEEIKMELAKSATSMARPRSQDDYSESVLVLRPS